MHVHLHVHLYMELCYNIYCQPLCIATLKQNSTFWKKWKRLIATFTSNEGSCMKNANFRYLSSKKRSKIWRTELKFWRNCSTDPWLSCRRKRKKNIKCPSIYTILNEERDFESLIKKWKKFWIIHNILFLFSNLKIKGQKGPSIKYFDPNRSVLHFQLFIRYNRLVFRKII